MRLSLMIPVFKVHLWVVQKNITHGRDRMIRAASPRVEALYR
jgi:hypothetical protein